MRDLFKNILIVLFCSLLLWRLVLAVVPAPNIDVINHWAWNEVIGWIDFSGSVEVNEAGAPAELLGYATSNVGKIYFNCNSTDLAGTNSCPPAFAVSIGALSGGTYPLTGYAWNDLVGWISFGSNTNDAVYLKQESGKWTFYGAAWNDLIGWITFNCADATIETAGFCTNFPNYKVQKGGAAPTLSADFVSEIFDTQVTNPVFNYILWRGNTTGVLVKFDVETSVDLSAWHPLDLASLTSNADCSNPDDLCDLSGAAHERYIRYKINFSSVDFAAATDFSIDDVIINYSP